MNISFGPDILGDFATSVEREWLETNGIGGFASSTLSGAHSRRYHGLLVAAILPPVLRMVMVSQLEEILFCDGHAYELSCTQYLGQVTPRGYRYLVSFHLAPCPTWVFQCGQVELRRSVLMPHGENTTIVTYELVSAPQPVRLQIDPVIACRDHGHLKRESAAANLEGTEAEGLLTLQPYPDVVPVHIAHPNATWTPRPRWVRNVEYHLELARGLDFQEDLMSPGSFTLELEPGARASFVISTALRKASDADELIERELSRRQTLTSGVDDFLIFWLRRSADQFLVVRADGGESVIAGYPWFCDWGRDTMISLPGLALAQGRLKMARGIIETFSRYQKGGLLPNRFPDLGEAPVYNSVDAALWYAYAAERYLTASQDESFAREWIYPTLQAIVKGFCEGTLYNIKMDSDGLVTQGADKVALTWMDAKMGDWVVTPRRGKPVEVNALWFNLLGFTADLAQRLHGPEEAEQYRQLSARVRPSFEKFWNASGGYLYDLLTPDGPDDAIRPNQIFALALPRMLLEPERARMVFAAVERELYTPLGLRSLSPKDPAFMARYEGDLARRDGAYHQGAVWGYLIGFYFTAYLNVFGRTDETRKRVRQMLVPFRNHLTEAGLGSISEIFDGDAPHRPAGCIAQAWSVAELLRVIEEELDGKPTGD